MLTAEDLTRIEAAVAEAETGSSGHIFCVLAGEVSSYREVPIVWGTIMALVAVPIGLGLGLWPLIETVAGQGWGPTSYDFAPQTQLQLELGAFALLQIAVFAAFALLVSLPPLRRALTPRFLKAHRVKKAAYHHFVAASSHVRDSETGVLLFIALVDRQVQVLADQAIHEKVGEAPWKAAAQAIQTGMKSSDPTDGIVKAITICGDALTAHFPAAAARAGHDRPLEI